MSLEYSPKFFPSLKKVFPAALLAGALCCGPALSQQGPVDSTVALGGESRGITSSTSLSRDASFEELREAVVKAQAMAAEGSSSPAGVAQVERAVEKALTNLDRYPDLVRIHGEEEPTWIVGRGDLVSQAILALAALNQVSPDPARVDIIEKLASGLTYLQRRNLTEYPFGAHISWRSEAPMAQLGDGTVVPTAFYETERAYAVQALAKAGRLLSRKALLESAQTEALGMSTHLVIHGDLVSSFSPQPKLSQNVDDALPLVEGFLALHDATNQKIYADLAALATRWNTPAGNPTGARWDENFRRIEAAGSGALTKAKGIDDPVTFQYIQAEDGKVVNKAIDTMDYRSSAGDQGQLAVMGRENTFWMRFDVPTEDDYSFDLSYLQSDVGGGLVSVMMRIDGDKIFQVPLGDVDGKPILRRKNVDGPRPLRSGPHSFGIRFSGLLMTKPALLDSVVVQPAVERRKFKLPSGEVVYLLRNATDEVGRVDKSHFPSWPPAERSVVNRIGEPAELGSSEDRRRRREFVTLPPSGVAILKFDRG